MDRVKELSEENIKKQKLAQEKLQEEIIRAKLKKIHAEQTKHVNWRRELEEGIDGMTTAGMGMINLGASDDALANIDVSDNTVSAVNSSVTSGGSGTSWNTGLNMGTEMISIAGSSNAKSFTLGSVDTSRATTITFKSLQGDYNNGGMANTNDTNVFYEDEDGGIHLMKTIPSNYVAYFNHSGEEHSDYPFIAGLFDTMTGGQEVDLRNDYSAYIAIGAEHGFSSSQAVDAQFVLFAKIIRYLNHQQAVTTHTFNLPASARGKGRIVISQASNSGSTWTNDMGFSNFEVKRTTPISVFVSLDDPEATAFIRDSLGNQNLSPEQKKKKLEEMLGASAEYLTKMFGEGIFTGASEISDVKLQQSFDQIAQGLPYVDEDDAYDDDYYDGPTPDFMDDSDVDLPIELAGNQGPSTPVRTDSDGRIVPNQGGGRPGNVRLKPHMLPRAGRRQPQYAHYEPEGEVIVEKKKLKSPASLLDKIPGYYDGKPAPLGFPIEEPPKMKNGYHPDLVDGKKVANRYNRLDPISAKAMPKTGNPHIDKKVRAAAKKPK